MQGTRLLQSLVLYLLCGYCVLSAGRGIPHHRHKHGSREEDGDDTRQHVVGSSCDNSFDSHLEKCLEPFSRKAHIYTTTHPQNPIVKDIFVKHVCRRYKKMLHCIHLVLTNCQTVTNIEIVQQKLDKRLWIVNVNKMCNIQSDPSTQKNSGDTGRKGSNSRHKVLPSSTTSLQPGSTQSVTQSEIEYYNMKSRDAADKIPHLRNNRGKNRDSHDSIPNIIPRRDREQFQQFGTKLVRPDQLTSLSSQNIPRLVTYIKYNVFLNGQEDDSRVESDKLQLVSSDTTNIDSILKDGQKPVMVQLLYLDTNVNGDRDTRTSSQQFSSLTAGSQAVGGCSSLLSHPVVVVSLILTVITTIHHT